MRVHSDITRLSCITGLLSSISYCLLDGLQCNKESHQKIITIYQSISNMIPKYFDVPTYLNSTTVSTSSHNR